MKIWKRRMALVLALVLLLSHGRNGRRSEIQLVVRAIL